MSESANGSNYGWLRRKFRESSVDGEFLRGAVRSVIVKLAGAVAGITSQFVLAKVLGAETFGQYVFVVSWVMLLLILGMVGFDHASVRFVATYCAHEEWSKLRGFLRRSRQVVLMSSLATAFCLASGAWSLKFAMTSTLFHAFLVGAILVPIAALLYVRSFQLRGFKRIVQAEGPLGVLRPAMIAGTVSTLAMLVTGVRFTVIHVLWINIAVTFLLLAFTSFLLSRAIPPASRRQNSEYDTQQWLSVAATMVILSGLVHIHARIDVLMVGVFVNTTDAGIYRVVADLAGLVTFGLGTLNVVVGPMISALHSQERFDELQRAASLVALGAFVVAAIALPLLLFAGETILGLFGVEFSRGYPALAIICVGLIASVITGPVGWILNMTGHHRQAVAITTVSVVANITLNAIFIPLFGIVGAAMATAVTVTLQNVIMFAYVKKYLRLNASLLPIVAVRRANL